MASDLTWTTACPDWERRIVSGESLIPCGPLFPESAIPAMDVFRSLKVVDAIGSPTIGECCRPWVLNFAEALFGALDPDTGIRRIKEYMLLVSKKNGKSTVSAAIMLTVLLRNWRNSNEFLILAPTIEAAQSAFKPAADMVRADPELVALLHVQDHLRTITHLATKAVLKVVAAENNTVSGKKAAGILVDELWLLGKKANAENMLREACGGQFSRPEGFTIYISTQSDEAPSGVFKQKLNYFRRVRDGAVEDPQSLGVLYEYPQHMIEAKQQFLPDNFYITNPNLGISVDRELLAQQLVKAQEAGEESLRGFASKHLNIEIGLGLRSDRWVGADYWEGAGDSSLTLDGILARAEVVTIGVDGGGADDLLGLAVLGRETGTRRWLHWGHAWAHPKALARRKSEESRYRDFAAVGDLTIIREYPEDLDGVLEIVNRVQKARLLSGVGMDTIGLAGIVDALASIGVTEDSGQVAGVGQGYVLTGAIKGLERKLVDGTFLHCNQSLMAWCVGNAKVEPTKNAFLITKQASGTAKIDPVMALFDASKLMERNPSPKGSVYTADRGIRAF